MSHGKYLLRDLKGNTELLILAEFMKNPAVKRREIADRLDVTEQAVSQYVSRLGSLGLIAEENGHPKLTRKGVQFLQERFSRLNEEIKEILREIRVIDTCVALAGARIKAGQRVGLIMRDGALVAVPRIRASSSGIARNGSQQGEEVVIGNLKGVVELTLGELLILQVPQESAGGSRRLNLPGARRIIKRFRCDQIAAGDLTGGVALRKLGMSPTIVHAPVEASMSALSKGLNVLFAGTRESTDKMLESVEELRNRTGYSIGFRLHDIGRVD